MNKIFKNIRRKEVMKACMFIAIFNSPFFILPSNAQIGSIDGAIGTISGGASVNSNFYIDYSAGVPVTFTAQSTGLTITHGILQPIGCLNKTFSTLNPTNCDMYTAPSGQLFTTSGTYTDTIPNSLGCDSIITINLTISNSTTSNISPAECEQYVSPSGKIFTASGTYSDTIPNTPGCDSVININLTIYSTPEFNTANLQTVSCFGGTDGQATLNPMAGIPPYYYQWSGAENRIGPFQQNLPAGTYTITMIDGNGCAYMDSVVISEPPAFTSNLSITDANCNAFDGAIDLSASGGTGTLEFIWNNGETTEDIDSLNAGLYVVTISDDNDCEFTSSASVNSIGGPVLTQNSVTPVSCHGGNDGAINASISGTYQIAVWSNGFTTNTIGNLQAGPYQLTAVDTLTGCNSILDVNVPEPAPLSVNVNVGNANCNASDGQAIANVTGGNGGYLYNWSTGGSSNAISNLAAGSYSVTVTDSKGCSRTKNFTVSEIGAPQVFVDSIIDAPCGSNTGSVYVTATGNTSGYTYSWDNGSSNEDLINAAIGNYSLTVTAPNTCRAFLTATITNAAPATPEICVVSVDSTSGSNVVVWERGPDSASYDYYNIWRESTAIGVYQLIGTSNAKTRGEFIDSVSNPLIKSYRYKLSVVDTCGTESMRSPAHKTIHLLQNLGTQGRINLLWNNYQGFPVQSYSIFRSSQMSWDSLTTLPANTFSFTDPNPPNGQNDSTLFYAVLAVVPGGCDPDKDDDYTRTRSNPSSTLFSPPLFSSLIESTEFDSFVFYPNPAKTKLFLKNSGDSPKNLLLEIFDINGNKQFEEIYNNEKGIDLKRIPSGFYIVKIKSEYKLYIRKILKI